MIITTFLSPTVGSGRTTAIMAVASAFLESGEKVAILDMTEDARGREFSDPSPLTVWEQLMPACGFGFEQFRVEEVHDFESMIRALCYCEMDGFYNLLVDTSAKHDDLVLNMVGRSDIVIIPVQNAESAVRASDWLEQHMPGDPRPIGLVCGVSNEEQELAVRSAFRGVQTFENELPFAPLLQQQRKKGHLFSAELHTETSGKLPMEELLAYTQNADACLAAKLISHEIDGICLRIQKRRTAELSDPFPA